MVEEVNVLGLALRPERVVASDLKIAVGVARLATGLGAGVIVAHRIRWLRGLNVYLPLH